MASSPLLLVSCFHALVRKESGCVKNKLRYQCLSGQSRRNMGWVVMLSLWLSSAELFTEFITDVVTYIMVCCGAN